MSLPLTATGSMMRWTASATKTPVTAQLHRTEARAARTSTRWYLRKTTAHTAVWRLPRKEGKSEPLAPVAMRASLHPEAGPGGTAVVKVCMVISNRKGCSVILK